MSYRAEDWKPGDVAMANDTTGGPERIAVCTGGGRWNYGLGDVWSSVSQVRRLVVIDPENDEQVGAFRSHLRRLGILPGDTVEDWQAALHEFANPKPDEPTGLGAVVRDRDGITWVNAGGPYPWRTVSHKDHNYADIDAVEVLSEGVTP